MNNQDQKRSKFTEELILLCLRNSPEGMKVIDIKKTMKQFFLIDNKITTFYTNLDRLEKKGLVEKIILVGIKKVTLFKITAKGEEHLKEFNDTINKIKHSLSIGSQK